jgi:AcrR family transcriptional regulator
MSPRARATRTRDPEGKRAAVLDAARRLFAQRGFAATTTADVARAAGVSEGIVFHHFGSKAELLEAIAGDYGRGLAEAMFQAAPARGGEVAAGPMLRAAFDYVRKHGALARLLKYAPDEQEKSAAKRATRSEIVGALARGFEAWSEAGLLRPMNARIAAELLFALVEAALIECFVHNRGADEDAYLRETIACTEGALRLVRAPAPEPAKRRTRK